MNHREVFCCYNGPPPWTCCFCKTPVRELGGETGDSDRGVVHHLDHDHRNNEPANLAAAHYSCHAHHHLVKGNIGRTHTEAARKNMGEAHRGKKLTASHRAAILAGIQRRSRCAGCGKEFNTVWMTRHRNEGRCV